MKHVVIIGAGTMGHGIAQVCAMAGLDAHLVDSDPDRVQQGIAHIRANLDKGIDRGKVSPAEADLAMSRVHATALEQAATDADIVIEAIPEHLELKQKVFCDVAQHASPDCIFGTNTSSLSITKIASAIPHPERVIGTHFFNPVHIMTLLELVVGQHTSPDVLAAVQALGDRLGKDVIVVQDMPGFATSRLGVCLGMEAIRMVEQGVASPSDIDKAMMLGYRHPIGPLKLTDLVGLDVRMAIGTYLAQELKNPAFEPPQLMREMVEAGRLGKKSGEGFYPWDDHK
jgi:3-hydroxybutyryl-CoA dehydrogenase